MTAFSKYSGAGNDFILIDDREGTFSKELVTKLCHRQLGIGADGILLRQDSECADARMVLYNRDGSRGEMCGNGLRCFAKHLGKEELCIETDAGLYLAKRIGEEISVAMPPPREARFGLAIEEHTLDYLDTGVPHGVLFVEDLEGAPVATLGAHLRRHPLLLPRGANIDFVTRLDPSTLALRTYERGVEGETLACGTGATAAAFAARHRGYQGPLIIHLRSKETLKMTFQPDGGVLMQGGAVEVFRGTFQLNPFSL